MKHERIYWDLETGPESDDKLNNLKPEFMPDARLTDPEKIKASITAKESDWKSRAALNGITGRIVAYSRVWDDEEPQFFTSENEKDLIEPLIDDLKSVISTGGMAFAYNSFGFDLPVLCQRASILGVPVFHNFTTNYRGRWSWHECFVDPMQVWCGPYQRSDGASLKAVGYALGLGLKTGNGKDFAELLKSDPEAAKAYALLDVKLLRGIVEKMGI